MILSNSDCAWRKIKNMIIDFFTTTAPQLEGGQKFLAIIAFLVALAATVFASIYFGRLVTMEFAESESKVRNLKAARGNAKKAARGKDASDEDKKKYKTEVENVKEHVPEMRKEFAKSLRTHIFEWLAIAGIAWMAFIAIFLILLAI